MAKATYAAISPVTGNAQTRKSERVYTHAVIWTYYRKSDGQLDTSLGASRAHSVGGSKTLGTNGEKAVWSGSRVGAERALKSQSGLYWTPEHEARGAIVEVAAV